MKQSNTSTSSVNILNVLVLVLSFFACGVFSYSAFANDALEQNENAVIESIQTEKINVNQASVEEIAEHLVGIGLAKAEAIVMWRKTNGHFDSVEQLLEVKGIGSATLDKIRDRLTL